MKKENRDAARSFRVSLIVLSLIVICFSSAILDIPILFVLLSSAILYDYFCLVGGILNWLNAKKDTNFIGTGIYRRLITNNAKILIFSTLTVFWVAFWNFTLDYSQNVQIDNCFLTMTVKEYIVYVLSGKLPISELPFFTPRVHEHYMPISMVIFIAKLIYLGNLINAIHGVILHQKLMGVKFAKYPPLTNLVYKSMIWARGKE